MQTVITKQSILLSKTFEFTPATPISYIFVSYHMLNWAFHGFGQAKFAYGDFRLKPIYTTAPAAFKMILNLKVVEIDLKRIIMLH